jgi:hypothetical protein
LGFCTAARATTGLDAARDKFIVQMRLLTQHSRKELQQNALDPSEKDPALQPASSTRRRRIVK